MVEILYNGKIYRLNRTSSIVFLLSDFIKVKNIPLNALFSVKWRSGYTLYRVVFDECLGRMAIPTGG